MDDEYVYAMIVAVTTARSALPGTANYFFQIGLFALISFNDQARNFTAYA